MVPPSILSTSTAQPQPSRTARPASPQEGARTMFARLTRAARTLRPAFRRLAALGMGAALAAGGLLPAQPAAADTRYDVQAIFQSVTFSEVCDYLDYNGWIGKWACDEDLEVAGALKAYTSPLLVGGEVDVHYRNFGRWDTWPPGCTFDGALWTSSSEAQCAKHVAGSEQGKSYSFQDVLLCASSDYNTCDTGRYPYINNSYFKNNNTITLRILPGQTITVGVHMKDVDGKWVPAGGDVYKPALDKADDVCKGQKSFGPYTASQLQALNHSDSINNVVNTLWNDPDAKCKVTFTLKKV